MHICQVSGMQIASRVQWERGIRVWLQGERDQPYKFTRYGMEIYAPLKIYIVFKMCVYIHFGMKISTKHTSMDIITD